MSKRKRKGANLDALAVAARKAARTALDIQFAWTADKHRGVTPSPRPKRRRREFAPLLPPTLAPSPVQPELISKPRNNVRALTVAALGKSATKRREDGRQREHYDRATLEALCAGYKRDQEKRRATMFAKGSAGKGSRNPGPRTQDWRARICK